MTQKFTLKVPDGKHSNPKVRFPQKYWKIDQPSVYGDLACWRKISRYSTDIGAHFRRLFQNNYWPNKRAICRMYGWVGDCDGGTGLFACMLFGWIFECCLCMYVCFLEYLNKFDLLKATSVLFISRVHKNITYSEIHFGHSARDKKSKKDIHYKKIK